MNAPQVVMIVLISLSMFASLLLHGKETKVNFFVSLLSNSLVIGLLIWGGFFA